jgi:ribosomal protein S18 acetylase RimI-like enzyme
MLFANATLAKRIELAEARLAADFGHLARRWRDDVLVAPVGGTCAVFAGPGEPFNKLAGLGFDGPIDEDALAGLEREFDSRQAPLQVEFASLGDNSIPPVLARRGYELVNFENVLGRPLTPSRRGGSGEGETRRDAEGALADSGEGPLSTSIVVAQAADDETAKWIDVVVTGFETPDTFDGPASHESFPRENLERVFSGLSEVRGFRRYLARLGPVIAGGAAIRISDGLAQLAGAATLPEHRRRGVQSALLQARLLDAAQAGCDLAVVTTQPGSKSQENVQRAGFELLYTRAILVRPPNSGGTGHE